MVPCILLYRPKAQQQGPKALKEGPKSLREGPKSLRGGERPERKAQITRERGPKPKDWG